MSEINLSNLAKLEISLIHLYRKSAYPIYSWLDTKGIKPIQCSYNPSCSHYTEQAIIKYGAINGPVKGLARILRCGPSKRIIDDPLD
ncbi:MAG: membrane protein insertion efficiency factor YidD [Nanoarchaeota archaeon]|nr:membrane protein insertion efficiency factor YidD [Nanoarchaeota archaeon]